VTSWTLEPTATPAVSRHCPRCEGKRPFVSTDKFRINGHQSRIDVWQIYQCSTCKFTWKLTLHTRVLPSSIPRELFDKYTYNDAPTAWRNCFDFKLIRRNGGEPDTHVDFKLSGPAVRLDGDAKEARVQIVCPFPINARLEAVLTKRLPLSRSQIERALDGGAIRSPDQSKLPRKIAADLEIVLDLAALRAIAMKEPPVTESSPPPSSPESEPAPAEPRSRPTRNR
jgi:hypothetical protein